MTEHSEAHDAHIDIIARLSTIEAILTERDRALTAAFTAQQNALNLATKNLELRLEKLNELRQEVTQDRSNFITRDKYEDAHGVLEEKVSTLEAFRGKALGFGALLSLISGVIGGVIIKVFS